MRIGLMMGASREIGEDLPGIVAFAQQAEAMGFDGLQVPDAIHDGFLLAALALNATARLKVLISVLVALPRSPMNVALTAWDLQAMSKGRPSSEMHLVRPVMACLVEV